LHQFNVPLSWLSTNQRCITVLHVKTRQQLKLVVSEWWFLNQRKVCNESYRLHCSAVSR